MNKVKKSFLIIAVLLFCTHLHARSDYKINDSTAHANLKVAYSNLGNMRWKNNRVEWWYNPKNQSNIGSTNKIIQSIKNAMHAWEEVSSLKFVYMGKSYQRLSNKSDSKFIIGWLKENKFNDRFGSFSGFTSVWWDGTNVNDAEISLNKGNWSSSNSLEDFEGLMTHELGHAIGLTHADNSESIMYANPYHDYAYQRTLRQYDIDDVQALYPIVRTWTTGTYSNNAYMRKVLSIDKVSALTVIIKGVTEENYDYIIIYDENDMEVYRFDGNINETVTVSGSSMKVVLTSDGSITKSGVTVLVTKF